MLHHKLRSACMEIIYVWQFLAELWSLTPRIFTHFSLSSQLLLHCCMDLNETWQGCCTTNLEVSKMNYLPTCTSRLVVQYSCQVSFKSMQGCRRSWEDNLICVKILGMKLGRNVAPQIQKSMWGNHSCSTNFGRVMALDIWNFYTFKERGGGQTFSTSFLMRFS